MKDKITNESIDIARLGKKVFLYDPKNLTYKSLESSEKNKQTFLNYSRFSSLLKDLFISTMIIVLLILILILFVKTNKKYISDLVIRLAEVLIRKHNVDIVNQLNNLNEKLEKIEKGNVVVPTAPPFENNNDSIREIYPVIASVQTEKFVNKKRSPKVSSVNTGNQCKYCSKVLKNYRGLRIHLSSLRNKDTLHVGY